MRDQAIIVARAADDAPGEEPPEPPLTLEQVVEGLCRFMTQLTIESRSNGARVADLERRLEALEAAR